MKKFHNNNNIKNEIFIKFLKFSNNFLKRKSILYRNLKNKRLRVRNKINENIIRKILLDNNDKSLTIKDIIKENQKISGINIKYNTMRNFIKQNLGGKFMNKRFKNEKNVNSNYLVMNLYFIEKYIELKKMNFHFISLDESSFQNTKKNPKGWVINDSDKYVFNNGRIKSISLNLCCDEYRVLKYSLTDKTYNKYSYIKFLDELVQKIQEDFDLSNHWENNKIILMSDNVRFHKCNSIKNFLNFKNINLLYFPPYNPTFNLIETCFSFLKQGFYRYNTKDK